MNYQSPKWAPHRRRWWGGLLMGFVALTACAGPMHLDVSMDGRETRPPVVLAGQKLEMVFTLTSAEVEQPELAVDLFATAGGLAAPLFNNRTPALSRIGAPAPGLQRFRFSLELPAVEKRQSWLLRARVRNDPAGAWLPLPVVMFDAKPVTWKDALRRFTRQHSCGRLAGGGKLEEMLRAAGVTVEEMSDGGPVPRVGLAEAGDGPLGLPESPATVWMVFKPGAPADYSFTRPVPGGPLVVALDARILGTLETDAGAQENFERVLSSVQAILASTEPPPSQP